MLIINYFIGMIVGSALVYDLFYRKIPNYLILTGYAGLGPYMYIRFGIDGIIQSAAAVCVVGVTLIFIYILGGLGAGDVKLICLICGFLGLKQAVYTQYWCSAWVPLSVLSRCVCGLQTETDGPHLVLRRSDLAFR